MNEEQERRTGALGAIALLGWQICVRLTKAAAKLIVQPRGQAATGAGEAENKAAAERAAVLVFGAMLVWQFGKSIMRRAGFLRESPDPQRPGDVSGSTTIAGRPVASHKIDPGEPNKPAPMEDSGCGQRGRTTDRDLDDLRVVSLPRREKWGTIFAAFAFAVAVVGGIGFVVTYWTSANNQLLGGMLALCFGGLGIAAVLWAHWLTAHKEAVERREDPSSAKDHEAATETFRAGAGEIRRRTLLGWIAAGGLGMIGVIVVSMFRSLGASPNNALYTTVWARGQRLMTPDGKPVRVDTLTPGSAIIVFPEDSVGSEKSQTVLVRVDPLLLRLPRNRRDWAPLGNLAYSRVCTHAGCPVGMYESTSHLLMCPCHQSTFDVLSGAEPTGGPAARPLPQLPLYTDSDGNLRAAGGFTEPPGPGFWGMPS
jgi:ubiquinol-cytochrome c reductase iron-sulfur subunit